VVDKFYLDWIEMATESLLELLNKPSSDLKSTEVQTILIKITNGDGSYEYLTSREKADAYNAAISEMTENDEKDYIGAVLIRRVLQPLKDDDIGYLKELPWQTFINNAKGKGAGRIFVPDKYPEMIRALQEFAPKKTFFQKMFGKGGRRKTHRCKSRKVHRNKKARRRSQRRS